MFKPPHPPAKNESGLAVLLVQSFEINSMMKSQSLLHDYCTYTSAIIMHPLRELLNSVNADMLPATVI